MNNYASNLEYLMEKLQITGTEIANHLNVDNSLVSKWKKNRRPLTINNAYLENLSSFILDYKNEIYVDTIEEFFKVHYPTSVFKDKEDIKNQLMLWLTEDYKRTKHPVEFLGKKGPVTFKGKEGRRKIILYFLDEILKEEKPQKIMIISQEETSWLIEDPVFLNNWKNKFSEIIFKGHRLNIVHFVERDLEKLEELISTWLPLYLTGDIKSWYSPRYSIPFIKKTLFLVPNLLAVEGMEGESYDDCYTTLVNDPLILKHYEWIFNKFIESCKPLVIKYPLTETAFLANLNKLNNNGELISYTKFPSFFTLPTEMFQELSKTISNSERQREKYNNYYTKLNSLFFSKEVKSMHGNDALKLAFENNNFTYEDLSIIAATKILPDNNFKKQHLAYLLEKASSEDNIQIAISNYFTDFNILVNSEGPLVIWNPDISDNFIFISEANVVAAYYNKLINEWNRIPKVHKEPETIRQRFLKP